MLSISWNKSCLTGTHWRCGNVFEKSREIPREVTPRVPGLPVTLDVGFRQLGSPVNVTFSARNEEQSQQQDSITL